MQKRRTIAMAVAVLTIGALLVGCPSAVTPAVKFSAGQLTISLSSMVVGQPISETLPEATGGEETLVYTLAPEVPGLTFDAATRVLSGTPTTPGTYDMTYTAKDSATGGTMESVTFTIAVVAPTITFAPETLTIPFPRMEVGEPVLVTLPEALRDEQSGEGTLVYTLEPEVPGLTFDAATRVLSGTPTTPGTYDMTYTAKDSVTGGTMESVTFVITVDPRPLTNQERILGTWQSGMNEFSEDDGSEGVWVDFLTFTQTRFILVRSHFNTDGSHDHSWSHRGTWEITDQEIVRIWYHNDDDDDDTPDVLVRFPKSYFFNGDELFIHHWADENVEDVSTNYDRMTRVIDASLSLPPLGIWEREQYEDESDWFEIETMTLKSDGRFTWSVQDPNGTWTLTAEWELDLDNYFINLKNATATWTETEGEPEPSDKIDGARFLRFAYAPMMSESGERRLRVSGYNNELEAPYGEYWREMKLQQ